MAPAPSESESEQGVLVRGGRPETEAITHARMKLE